MSILQVLKDPNPLLRQPCAPVTTFDDTLQQLINDLFETTAHHNGIGLAAPQIGVLEQVLVIHYEDQKFELINPKITKKEGSFEGQEGCLSIPNTELMVKRARTIQVNAQDKTGAHILAEFDPFISIIVQHEIDHLKGTLITDIGTPIPKEQNELP